MVYNVLVMNNKKFNTHHEAQRHLDEIINLSSLLDVCVSEKIEEKTNYLDVDLILRAPLSPIKAKRHDIHSAPKKAHVPHIATKVHVIENKHEVTHPKRESLIHFHGHTENRRRNNDGFFSLFESLKFS